MTKTPGFMRRIAGSCIARPLSAVGVTRNQLSATRLAFGVLTALTLLLGPTWFSVAAALFLVGIFLQRSDDELARRVPHDSPTNDRFAFVSDNVSNALAFAALGIAMRTGEYGLKSIAMGLLAAFAVVALSGLTKRLEGIEGKRSAEFDGVAGLDADDALLLFPAALWAGWAQGLLMLTAIGATTFAGALYVTHYRKFTSD